EDGRRAPGRERRPLVPRGRRRRCHVTMDALVPTAAPKPAIRVRHLWHRFGKLDVLRDVSFDVHEGKIFGFIGPNGAGMTTTIRVMAKQQNKSRQVIEKE